MNELVLKSAANAYASIAYGDQLARTGELAIVLGISAACDLHQVDETTIVEGAERWVRGGADGTPLVGEFVAGEVAALLGINPSSAFGRIAQVLNVRHRHPCLWEQFCAGQVWFWQAAVVADQCAVAGLDREACLRVDRLCDVALQLQPWNRKRNQLPEWIVRADPALAAERAAGASAGRHVTVDPIVDGHCDLWGRLDAADGVLLDQALDAVADTLPTDLARDHRRAAALGTLARGVLGQAELPVPHAHGQGEDRALAPTQTQDQTQGLGAVGVTLTCADDPNAFRAPVVGGARLVRTAELVVHLTAADVARPGQGVAMVDRWGVVLAHQLRRLLEGCRVGGDRSSTPPGSPRRTPTRCRP
ncbi:MAG TPA: DUF222 domain-containing protein [Dermatophilaceae bacterium]